MKLDVNVDRMEGVAKYNVELYGDIDPALVEMLEAIGLTDFHRLSIDVLTWTWKAEGSAIRYD